MRIVGRDKFLQGRLTPAAEKASPAWLAKVVAWEPDIEALSPAEDPGGV